MIPVLALVGRPNVGKSTLFNTLTGSRHALVTDVAGTTRDRLYGDGKLGEKPFIVIDTAGIGDGDTPELLRSAMQAQTTQAMAEADVIWWIVDARDGLTEADLIFQKPIRQYNKPIYVIVNKIDGGDPTLLNTEFYQMGFPLYPATARNGFGVAAVLAESLKTFVEEDKPLAEDEKNTIAVAIVGRPNVGKSTLINRLLGVDRLIVADYPGTTRDSIILPYTYRDQKYALLDTAGVRRRHKAGEVVEKFSVAKTLQAIKESHIVMMILNAREGIYDQDLDLLDFICEAGKGLIIAFNQCDDLDEDQNERLHRDIDRRLHFVDFAPQYFISAKTGKSVSSLLPKAKTIYEAAGKTLSTNQLTTLLEEAIARHQPPLVRGRRIKLRYAHTGGHYPPTIIIHGKQTENLPEHYRRYLIHFFRKALKLEGTPIRLFLRSDDNPYS